MQLPTFYYNESMPVMLTSELDDDYSRFLLHGHLDFILLDYTKRLHERPETMSADLKMVAVVQNLS